MSFRKHLKSNLKYFLIKIINIIKKITNLSDKTIGIIIRSYHIVAPRDFIIILLLAPKPFCLITIIFLLIVYFLIFIFSGCFLSIIEQELCEDEFSMLDPALEICRMEINNKNRIFISYISGYFYLFSICLIYYFRFLYNKTTVSIGGDSIPIA
jgi:YHS domain-containing protein